MTEQSSALTASVKQRFASIAEQPDSEKVFPVGIKSAKRLGYDAQWLNTLPPEATESFCGVGNPLSLGSPQWGQTVLDIGCGAGLDCFLASQFVGKDGRVIGIDVTEAMVEKAKRIATNIGIASEFTVANAEQIPLGDETVDMVISNGVINLCPDKERVLSEVYRVLRPGGRLQMADILLHDEVTEEEVAQKGEWSD